MILERVIGSIEEQQFQGLQVEYIDIEWYNSHKKIDRLTTQLGREIGIRLDEETVATGLKQDDVLWVEEGKALAVNILPCECLVAHVEQVEKLPKFCYEIGNRHAPFFYGNHPMEFIVPFDKPMMKMIENLGIHVDVAMVKIDFTHSISGNTGHSHEHSHEHSHQHGSHHEHGHQQEGHHEHSHQHGSHHEQGHQHGSHHEHSHQHGSEENHA